MILNLRVVVSVFLLGQRGCCRILDARDRAWQRETVLDKASVEAEDVLVADAPALAIVQGSPRGYHLLVVLGIL